MPAGEPASTPMLLSDHCGHYSQNSLYTTHIQFIHDTYTILQIYKTIANTDVTTQEASVAGRHIPSSMCFRTLHPYLVIMPTCDLANFLNAIHNPEYQNPCFMSFCVSV